MTDVYAVARTACMEAASDGADGIHAVINVIYNRAKTPGWWGSSPADIALKESNGVHQFSCWNAGSPTLTWGALLTVGGTSANDKLFSNAVIMNNLAQRKALTDITKGADSYYREGTPVPSWAKGRSPVAKIGSHLFFIVGLTGNGPKNESSPDVPFVAPASDAGSTDALLAEIAQEKGDSNKIVASLRNALLYAIRNPAQWLAETTTLLGFAIMGVAFWEYLAQALTLPQAEGLLAAGAALLYPQSGSKAAAVVTTMTTVMDAIEAGRVPPALEKKP